MAEDLSLAVTGTAYRMPLSALRAWHSQIAHNYGLSPTELVAEGRSLSPTELWLAAHGKPAMDRLVSPEQALEWLESLPALERPARAAAAPETEEAPKLFAKGKK